MKKKKIKKAKNYNNIDSSTKEASHLTSDISNSFNQVSFNVLENTAKNKENIYGNQTRDFTGRAIISSDEMLHNKNPKPKRNNSRLGKIAIISFALLFVFVILYISISYFISHGYFKKIKHSTPLIECIFDIEKCDASINKLDTFLKGSINENSINRSKMIIDEINDTKDTLLSISKKIDVVAKDMPQTNQDYQYIGVARQSIESRIMMIDVGLKILKNAENSILIINKTEAFWDNILKADSKLKESDNLVQSNLTDNYKQAKVNSEKAIELLYTAKNQLVELSNQTKAFDFEIYYKYIEARLDSAKVSVDACQAMVDLDLGKITELNILYIEKSNIASDIALKMSTTPVQVLRTDYDLTTRSLIEEYKAARRNAADNDFALRNFLSMSL